MLDLGAVASNPQLLTSDVALPGGDLVRLRPLLPRDVEALTEFLESLSPLTRYRWLLPSYDRAAAQEMCDAVGRHGKLRLVAVDRSGVVFGLFELSFEILEKEHARFGLYGIELDERHDCRFGPCLRDSHQRRGLASALMPSVDRAAAAFGRTRMILWGGVLADNAPARAFYARQGFSELGRFHDREGCECVDMVRTIPTQTAGSPTER